MNEPLVSIGLPVYNGENYLQQAIDSILRQDYKNLELVIVDNASRDETQVICEAAASSDSRIKYHRNEENLGAAANYNLAFEKSTGEYFKWAAHDDLCEPSFISRCIDVLEQDKDVSLVFTVTKVVDSAGNPVRMVMNDLDTANSSPVIRFKELLGNHVITEIFGVIRRLDLVGTKLIAPYPSSDRMLLSNLALKGRFSRIPDPLFIHRDHDERSHKKLKTAKERAGWFDPSRKSKRTYPAWRFIRELVVIVCGSSVSLKTKFMLMVEVARWAKRNSVRLLEDIRG